MEEQVRDDGGGAGAGGVGRVARRFARPKPAADWPPRTPCRALRVGGWRWTDRASSACAWAWPTSRRTVRSRVRRKKTTGKASEGGGRTLAALKLDGTKPLGDLLPEIKRGRRRRGRD